jgi:hypothetical protein
MLMAGNVIEGSNAFRDEASRSLNQWHYFLVDLERLFQPLFIRFSYSIIPNISIPIKIT